MLVFHPDTIKQAFEIRKSDGTKKSVPEQHTLDSGDSIEWFNLFGYAPSNQAILGSVHPITEFMNNYHASKKTK